MTQEDKDLLIKDTSARLPYGVICRFTLPTHEDCDVKITPENIEWFYNNVEIDEFKVFLRPMPSMTDEEYDQLYIDSRVKEDSVDILDALANDLDAIDWLNAHHFDYRGLIEKGLALEAPKDMYK